MRALPIAAVALVATSAPAFAAPLPMEDMVRAALGQSPTLAAAERALDAQEAREEAARSPYWPQVAVNAGLAQTTSVSTAQTVAQPFSLANTALTVRQNLFTFGKLESEVDQAQARTAIAASQAALTAVEVAFDVRQAYLRWAEAAALETQARELLRFAEATQAEARARLKTGVAAQLDVTRAETTVAQARARLATARANAAQARRTLAAAIGQSAPVAGEPQFPATPALASRSLPELQATALDHPNLLATRAQLAQAQAVREAAERAGLPNLTADASYGIRARDFQGAPNWQAGFGFSWPLFTGFNVTNQAEAARAQEASVAATFEARRLEILRDVDNAYLSLEGARESVPAATAAVAAARENMRQAQGRYRGGVGSIIEVADAQQLLAQAQAELARATTTYHLALASLQRALGTTGVTP